MTHLGTVSQKYSLSPLVIGGLILALTAPLAGQTSHLSTDEVQSIARAEEVSNAFTIVARNARPSVGRIVGYGARGSRMTGSGFVIDDQGHMLTNSHVVQEALSLIVEFTDGSSRRAQVIGTDPLTDLAVIKVNGAGLPPLEFAPDEHLEVGRWVVAIGFPLGLDQTVTTGVISAINRHLDIVGSSVGQRGYEDFIQTDAAINRGNSGGPLLNMRGQVVGINAVIVTQTGGSDGLGFAIPTSLARFVTDQLIRTGRVTRAWLGVALQDLTPPLARSYGLASEQSGVLLTMVSADEPAGRAGLRVEDIITRIDDKPIEDVEHLRALVARMTPGRTAHLEVYRDGRSLEIPVVLAAMSETPSTNSIRGVTPPANAEGRIGIRLADLNPSQLESIGESTAVAVTSIFPGSVAQLAGLSEGDLIVQVNGQPLKSVSLQSGRGSHAQWILNSIHSAPSGSVLRFTIRAVVTNARGRVLRVESNRSYVGVEIP